MSRQHYNWPDRRDDCFIGNMRSRDVASGIRVIIGGILISICRTAIVRVYLRKQT